MHLYLRFKRTILSISPRKGPYLFIYLFRLTMKKKNLRQRKLRKSELKQKKLINLDEIMSIINILT